MERTERISVKLREEAQECIPKQQNSTRVPTLAFHRTAF